MKKTLIALIALGSVTMAADADLLWTMTFGSDADSTKGFAVTTEDGVTFSPSCNKDNTTMHVADLTTGTGINSRVHLGGATTEGSNTSIRFCDAFSLVVNVTLPAMEASSFGENTTTPAVFFIGEEWASWGLAVGFDRNNKNIFSVTGKNGYADSTTSQSYDIAATEGNHTIILTLSGGTPHDSKEAATDDITINMYVDGKLAYTATKATPHDITYMDNICLSGCDNTQTMSAAYTGLQMYSGVLSAQQIKALSTPEPTTATLSLLALAGLAARRRRH